MRIGLIAPPWCAVPPTGYGGTEAVIDTLARALRARGHEITLFTVGTSTCPVRRLWHYRDPATPMGVGLPEAVHDLTALESLRGLDVVHDHTTLGPLLSLGRLRPGTAIVTTIHGPFTPDQVRALAHADPGVMIVAISEHHRRTAPPGLVSAVVHHGVDLERFPLGPGDGHYLLFMGRMAWTKGVHRAIRIARAAGRRLVVIAKMREPEERAYYDDRVRPILGRDIEILGEISVPARVRLMQHAEALINPIRWPEPFGLVMVEALATGTPVLAFPEGAAPEIVEDGRTGFLRNTEPELVAAVDHIGQIDRSRCRASAEQRFSPDRMAQAYEAVYRSALTRGPADTITLPGAPRRVPSQGPGRVHVNRAAPALEALT